MNSITIFKNYDTNIICNNFVTLLYNKLKFIRIMKKTNCSKCNSNKIVIRTPKQDPDMPKNSLYNNKFTHEIYCINCTHLEFFNMSDKN